MTTPVASVLSEFEQRTIATYAYLNQAEWWHPRPPRPPVRIAEMNAGWRSNAARWFEGRARYLAFHYNFGEVFSLARPGGYRVVLGEADGRVVLGGRLSNFDLMPDCVMDDLDRWQAEREADAVAWLRETSLYRALVSGLTEAVAA